MSQNQITTNASAATTAQDRKWETRIYSGRTFICETTKGEEGALQIAEVTGVKGRTAKNARLLAAAPTLLAALKALEDHVSVLEELGANLGRGERDDYMEVLEQARNAITEAAKG